MLQQHTDAQDTFTHRMGFHLHCRGEYGLYVVSVLMYVYLKLKLTPGALMQYPFSYFKLNVPKPGSVQPKEHMEDFDFKAQLHQIKVLL